MNNTKLAGAIAAGIIAVPLGVGIFGGGDGKHAPDGKVKDGVESAADHGETKGEDSPAKVAETEGHADEGKTVEAAEVKTESAETKTEEPGEISESESAEGETDAEEKPETAEAETEEPVSETTTAEATDPTDDSEAAEASAEADAEVEAAKVETEDAAPEATATETTAVIYTPPPPTKPAVDPEPKFEDTTGDTASSSGGAAVELAMNTVDEPKAPEPSETTEVSASEKPTGREIAGFGGLTSGTAYADARSMLVNAGWSPRELTEDDRLDALDDKEKTFIEAGYAELEGCESFARMICRFEFLGDDGKIAAVLTSGDEAATVIDAFVMDVE